MYPQYQREERDRILFMSQRSLYDVVWCSGVRSADMSQMGLDDPRDLYYSKAKLLQNCTVVLQYTLSPILWHSGRSGVIEHTEIPHGDNSTSRY